MKMLPNIFRYALLLPLLLAGTRATAQKQMAITIDDPTVKSSADRRWQEKNEALLQALAGHKIKAALFVCGMRVDNEEGRQLLSSWDGAGHLICNHSYTHLYFDGKAMNAASFIADFKKGDSIIQGYAHYTKLFRFPYLKQGNTQEKRDSMQAAMAAAGYRNGYVSIDASDWYIDGEMIKALTADPRTDLRPYRDYYIRHILDRAAYYDSLAMAVYTKPVKHTLLIHHSLLNALFLDDVLKSLEAKGWTLIDAGDAFADPLYRLQPEIAPKGESIIWQLAKEAPGTAGSLRYPGEDGAYEKEPLADWIARYKQ